MSKEQFDELMDKVDEMELPDDSYDDTDSLDIAFVFQAAKNGFSPEEAKEALDNYYMGWLANLVKEQ